METQLQGANAEFLDGGGNSKEYELEPYSTRRFDVKLEPENTGPQTFKVETIQRDLRIQTTDTLQVYSTDFEKQALPRQVTGIQNIHIITLLIITTAIIWKNKPIHQKNRID